jgi:hypothetical protein
MYLLDQTLHALEYKPRPTQIAKLMNLKKQPINFDPTVSAHTVQQLFNFSMMAEVIDVVAQ